MALIIQTKQVQVLLQASIVHSKTLLQHYSCYSNTRGVTKAWGIKPFSRDLRRVRWPLNFKPLGIDMYDGSTNPAEWLEVYQLTIKAVGGDSYVMSNYMLICISSSARTWLMGLPTGSVRSWSDLWQQFVSNFRATCARPRVNWNLANIVQKKGESLRRFI
jgi:hypothetical protein